MRFRNPGTLSGFKRSASVKQISLVVGDGSDTPMEVTMNQWTNAKLCDVGNLILGTFLFLSPWVFKYPTGAESWNAMAAGVIIALLSIAALTTFTVWEEWLNLVIGLWLIVSPWALKFQGTSALRTEVIVGLVVAVLAVIELWSLWQEPPGQTAN
jgi:hypothetical protein